MNARSVTGSAAVVACLVVALVVGALGMVACGGGEQAATPKPTGASPAAEPATPTERVSFSFTAPANGMAVWTESPAFTTQGGPLTARLIVDRWYTAPSSDGYGPSTIVWAGAPGFAYDEGPSPEAQFDLTEGPGKYEAEIVNGHDEYPVAGEYILHVDGAHFDGTITVLEAARGGETTSSTSPVATSPVPTAIARAGGHREGLVWKIETGAAVHSTPAVSQGVVCFGNDAGHLYAVDLQSGRQRWAFATGGSILSALAVADGAVYCRSVDGYLYAVDIQSGREMWKFKAGGAAESSAAVGGGIVYVAAPSTSEPDGDDLYALDGAGGRVIWQATMPWGKVPKGDTRANINITSPVASRGVVYYGAWNTLYALDGETGERLWKSRGSYTGTPAVAPGLLYGREIDNWPFTRVSAVDAESGERRWVSRMFSRQTIARFTSPTVGGEVVYVTRGNGALFALDGHTGRERWRSRQGLAGEATPAVAGGLVCVAGHDGYLNALDADTGRIAWKFETGAGVLTSPVISNGMVYVGGDDGSLYVVK